MPAGAITRGEATGGGGRGAALGFVFDFGAGVLAIAARDAAVALIIVDAVDARAVGGGAKAAEAEEIELRGGGVGLRGEMREALPAAAIEWKKGDLRAGDDGGGGGRGAFFGGGGDRDLRGDALRLQVRGDLGGGAELDLYLGLCGGEAGGGDGEAIDTRSEGDGIEAALGCHAQRLMLVRCEVFEVDLRAAHGGAGGVFDATVKSSGGGTLCGPGEGAREQKGCTDEHAGRRDQPLALGCVPPRMFSRTTHGDEVTSNRGLAARWGKTSDWEPGRE